MSETMMAEDKRSRVLARLAEPDAAALSTARSPASSR